MVLRSLLHALFVVSDEWNVGDGKHHFSSSPAVYSHTYVLPKRVYTVEHVKVFHLRRNLNYLHLS